MPKEHPCYMCHKSCNCGAVVTSDCEGCYNCIKAMDENEYEDDEDEE